MVTSETAVALRPGALRPAIDSAVGTTGRQREADDEQPGRGHRRRPATTTTAIAALASSPAIVSTSRSSAGRENTSRPTSDAVWNAASATPVSSAPDSSTSRRNSAA